MKGSQEDLPTGGYYALPCVIIMSQDPLDKMDFPMFDGKLGLGRLTFDKEVNIFIFHNDDEYWQRCSRLLILY